MAAICNEKDVEYDYFEVANTWKNKRGEIVLAPTTRKVLIVSQSKALSQNFQIARELICYVNEKVPYSSNFLSRSKSIRSGKKPILKELVCKIHCRSASHFKKHFDFSLKSLRKRVIITTCYKIGNCTELADVGYFYALKKYPEKEKSISVICFGNHAFMTLGSGQDQIVVDLWSSSYYPIDQIETYLYDFVKLKVKGDSEFTIVKKYDPATQQIIQFLPPPEEEEVVEDLS